MAIRGTKAFIATKEQARKAIQEVEKRLQETINKIEDVSEEELQAIALTILNKSNGYAPLDEGELIDSSYIETERLEGNVTVEIGYGKDGKAPYSVYQHELYGTSYKNPTTPGTKPKFLQSAVTETEADIDSILAQAIKSKVGL